MHFGLARVLVASSFVRNRIKEYVVMMPAPLRHRRDRDQSKIVLGVQLLGCVALGVLLTGIAILIGQFVN
jgi:hypothetical protein